jgi:hypothetical protein
VTLGWRISFVAIGREGDAGPGARLCSVSSAGLASAVRMAYLAANRANDRAHMSKSRAAPAKPGRPSLAGSAEIDAMVARTAPSVLELLADGVARPRSAIITALADRHPKEDVIRTLMRLAVTGQLVETERKYSLAPTAEPEGEGG